MSHHNTVTSLLSRCGTMNAESNAENSSPESGSKPRQKKRRGRRLTGISKQRRQANNRERHRVHVLNDTIETLRELVPLFPHEKKPSKTETIRLAALYILHMTELLQSTEISEDDTSSELSFVTLNESIQDCDTGLDAEELVRLYWKENEDTDV